MGIDFSCALGSLRYGHFPEKDCLLPLISKLLDYVLVAAYVLSMLTTLSFQLHTHRRREKSGIKVRKKKEKKKTAVRL